MEKTLELDADKRITAEEALAHPYLAQYADPSDEPCSPPYDQSFEDMDVSVEEWKGINIALLLFYVSIQSSRVLTHLYLVLELDI